MHFGYGKVELSASCFAKIPVNEYERTRSNVTEQNNVNKKMSDGNESGSN